MAAKLLISTSYILFALFLIHLESSNALNPFQQDDRSCLRQILESCFLDEYTAQTSPDILSWTLEDHCRIGNKSFECAANQLKRTDGQCRFLSEDTKTEYANYIRVGKDIVGDICGNRIQRINTTYVCLVSNQDRFLAQMTSCLLPRPTLGSTIYDDTCDLVLDVVICADKNVREICGSGIYGWNAVIDKFELAVGELGLLPNCPEMRTRKETCQLWMEITCLEDFDPRTMNTKTLKELCGMVKKAGTCADNYLQNKTSKCSQLTLQQKSKYNLLSSMTWDKVNYVCESPAFSKFNAAYECLYYQFTNIQQLRNLSRECLPRWRSLDTEIYYPVTFCSKLKRMRSCAKSVSTTVCGAEIGNTEDESFQLIYLFGVQLGAIPHCPDSPHQRSLGDILMEMLIK